MKFENLLSKKVKELEVLTESLQYKEKELLVKYKDRLEEDDLEQNQKHYEVKGLLDSDSDEDKNQESDEDEKYFDFQDSRGLDNDIEEEK